MALTAMSITNFLLDAPLTIILTNFLNKKSGIKNSETTQDKKKGK